MGQDKRQRRAERKRRREERAGRRNPPIPSRGKSELLGKFLSGVGFAFEDHPLLPNMKIQIIVWRLSKDSFIIGLSQVEHPDVELALKNLGTVMRGADVAPYAARGIYGSSYGQVKESLEKAKPNTKFYWYEEPEVEEITLEEFNTYNVARMPQKVFTEKRWFKAGNALGIISIDKDFEYGIVALVEHPDGQYRAESINLSKSEKGALDLVHGELLKWSGHVELGASPPVTQEFVTGYLSKALGMSHGEVEAMLQSLEEPTKRRKG